MPGVTWPSDKHSVIRQAPHLTKPHYFDRPIFNWSHSNCFSLLRNAMEGGVFGSCYFSITKVYDPTLLVLQSDVRVSNFQEKSLCST